MKKVLSNIIINLIQIGLRFALREGGKTIAAGVVAEILPDEEEEAKKEEDEKKKAVKPGAPGQKTTTAAG